MQVIPMASITIRNLDENVKSRLRRRAAQHQRSMEEEARNILRIALTKEEVTAGSLATAIQARFQAFGGVELSIPVRGAIRPPPKPSR